MLKTFVDEALKEIILLLKEIISNTQNADNKTTYRLLHEEARRQAMKKNSKFLKAKGFEIIKNYFADGKDINISKIKPRLLNADEGEFFEIFKTARFTWSLPYTNGYGRRLRFIVIDESNGKLIGILGFHSPVLGLRARNEWLGIRGKEKTSPLNQTMDIYTLGAVPPYNFLLGGKLMAMTAVANEVRETYRSKYGGKTTLIAGNKIDGELVLLTTTSAFGRSSLYNRVKFKDKLICYPIGYTTGYGVSHIPEVLFDKIKNYLLERGIKVKGGYGNGPNYRFRLINAFLKETSRILNPKEIIEVNSLKDIIKHGVPRQVYVFPLAENVREYLHGIDNKPVYFNYPFEELANYWRERYLLPRSMRNNQWVEWRKETIIREWEEILER